MHDIFDPPLTRREARLYGLGVLVMAVSFNLVALLFVPDDNPVPLHMTALLAGLVYQGKRMHASWKGLFVTMAVSYVLSFFSMLFVWEGVFAARTLSKWPFHFICWFLISVLINHGEKLRLEFNEGVTMIYSLAFVYWLYDYGFLQWDATWKYFALPVIAGLFLFSLFHGLSNARHNRTSRVILSLWSTTIITILSIENACLIFQYEEIESIASTTRATFIGLQFFILGVSSFFLVQNAFLLIGLLPPGLPFTFEHRKQLRKAFDEHENRYNAEQITFVRSFIAAGIASTCFAMNHFYQFVPRNLAIWMVFILIPLLVPIIEYLGSRKAR